MGRTVRTASRALLLAATQAGLLALGCAPRNQSVSTALDKAYALDCPPENIQVISHRRIGSDELWAVEACGTKREVELGLEFPATPGAALSEAELQQIVENLKPESGQESSPKITSEMLLAARAKAGQWCSLGGSDAAGVGASNQSSEEQRACQQRLEAATSALGTERDEQGIVRYWFRVGSWAFPAFVSYHAPACSRLTLVGTPEQCACAKAAGQPASCSPALVASSEQTEAGAPDDPGPARRDAPARRAATPSRVALFARAGLGLGYLSSAGDDVATAASVAVQFDLWGGLQLHPRFGLGVGLSRYDATSDDSVTYSRVEDMTFISGSAQVRPQLWAPAALVSALPFSIPLRVDAELGIGLLTRASPRAELGLSKSAGLYMAGGLGWQVVGDYIDVGLSGKVFLANTEDASDSFSTSGYGLLLNLWTHPRRQPKPETDEGD